MKIIMKALLLTTALSLWVGNVLADPVWIDVRTDAEYSDDHIMDDANIPLATIDPIQLASQFGKNAEINLYCRSGGRAGQAKEILEAAGFTNITNVGGIDNARELRNIPRSSNAQ